MFLIRLRDLLLDWERRRQFSVGLLIFDTLAVWGVLRAVFCFSLQQSAPDWLLALGGGAFAISAVAAGLHRIDTTAAPTLLLRAIFLPIGWSVAYQLGRTGAWHLYDASTWSALAIALALIGTRFLRLSLIPTQEANTPEFLRWAILGTGAAWAVSPFFHAGGIGTGDAHWYAVMLADYVQQIRSGVFPVWVGQTEFAFNGAISPLRFAPWYQLSGGLLDILTGGALSPLALRNALVVLHGGAAALGAYLCLRRILAAHANFALLLALVYAFCPGYLAPLLAGDQFMTYLTVPFLPVVCFGLHQVAHERRASGDRWVTVGLAGLWLAHAPVAMWTTFAAAAIWSATAIRERRWVKSLTRIAKMGACFAVLGLLPFVSIAALSNQFSAPLLGTHVYDQVAQWFPANFFPIHPSPERMPMYQIGYASLACVLLTTAAWIKSRASSTVTVLAVIGGILVLTIPVPVVTRAIWQMAPSAVIAINNVWPTQRLFGLLTALTVFALAGELARGAVMRSRTFFWVAGLTLLAGVVWSFREARKLHLFAAGGIVSPARVAGSLDPRNVMLTRYAYASFKQVPSYVSHGVMDELLENRLLTSDSSIVLASNAESAAPRVLGGVPPERLRLTGALVLRRTGDNSWSTSTPITLEPGAHYALRIELNDPATVGTLTISAGKLFRQYALPDSGSGMNKFSQSQAFGTGPNNSHVLGLRALDPAPTNLEIVFTGEPNQPEDFGRFWLYTIKPGDLPVAMDALVPYHATCDSAFATLLETPRVWMKGYLAVVNGHIVAPVRSRDGLVGVPLPAGRSTVEVRYVPPWWLEATFWTTLLGWSIWGVMLLLAGARQASANS